MTLKTKKKLKLCLRLLCWQIERGMSPLHSKALKFSVNPLICWYSGKVLLQPLQAYSAILTELFDGND